jgi:hypothetical protein
MPGLRRHPGNHRRLKTVNETHDITFEGVHLRLHSSHADADRILAENGWQIPSIPDGCNTALFYFQTKEGLQALAVNQRAFAPLASDNEQEVNGCTVLLCLDSNLDLIDARALLKRFYEHLAP